MGTGGAGGDRTQLSGGFDQRSDISQGSSRWLDDDDLTIGVIHNGLFRERVARHLSNSLDHHLIETPRSLLDFDLPLTESALALALQVEVILLAPKFPVIIFCNLIPLGRRFTYGFQVICNLFLSNFLRNTLLNQLLLFFLAAILTVGSIDGVFAFVAASIEIELKPPILSGGFSGLDLPGADVFIIGFKWHN